MALYRAADNHSPEWLKGHKAAATVISFSLFLWPTVKDRTISVTRKRNKKLWVRRIRGFFLLIHWWGRIELREPSSSNEIEKKEVTVCPVWAVGWAELTRKRQTSGHTVQRQQISFSSSFIVWALISCPFPYPWMPRHIKEREKEYYSCLCQHLHIGDSYDREAAAIRLVPNN